MIYIWRYLGILCAINGSLFNKEMELMNWIILLPLQFL